MRGTTPQRCNLPAEHAWRNHLDAANQASDLFDRLRDELTEDPQANAPALALLLTLENAVKRSDEHAYTAVQLLTTATP